MSYKRIIKDGKPHYGKHVILHAENCNDHLLDKDKIKEFVVSMADSIDMVRFGDAFVERFGDGIEVGISAVQLIETSAIVIHTNDGARELYLDVFSCKDYDEAIVYQCVADYFGAKSTTITAEVIYRE